MTERSGFFKFLFVRDGGFSMLPRLVLIQWNLGRHPDDLGRHRPDAAGQPQPHLVRRAAGAGPKRPSCGSDPAAGAGADGGSHFRAAAQQPDRECGWL